MLILSRLAGTLASVFRIGTLKLKDVAGTLVLRNAADTQHANLEINRLKMIYGPANGAILSSDANGLATWKDPSDLGLGANEFTDLIDVPDTYIPGKFVAVNEAGDGLEFVDAPAGDGGSAAYFTDLNDTPEEYQGHGGKFLAVKGTEDGVEFVVAPSGGGFGMPVRGTPENGDLLVYNAFGVEYGEETTSPEPVLPARSGDYQATINTYYWTLHRPIKVKQFYFGSGENKGIPFVFRVKSRDLQTVYYEVTIGSTGGTGWRPIGPANLDLELPAGEYAVELGNQGFLYWQYGDGYPLSSDDMDIWDADSPGSRCLWPWKVDYLPGTPTEQLVWTAPNEILDHGGGTPASQTLITFEGDLEPGASPLRIYNATDTVKLISKVFLSLSDAPTGADVIVDVHKDGISIFASQDDRPKVLATETTGEALLDTEVEWAPGEYLTVEIDQIGSTFPGANLVVHVIATGEFNGGGGGSNPVSIFEIWLKG